MQQKNPEADAILKAIQQREQEHLLQLSLCNLFANISTKETLACAVKRLKDTISFDNFALGVCDEFEKEYQIFFHDNMKIATSVTAISFNANDGIFDKALNSAEPIFLDLRKLKNTSPYFIEKALQDGIREVIAMPLPYDKNNPSVLFLFFKGIDILSRQDLRLLRNVTFQIGLAVSNILVNQQIEKHHNALKNLKNNAKIITDDVEVEINSEENFSGIIGQSDAIKKVIHLVKTVASSNSGVLLLGESGTGKEVVAQAIHANSSQKNKPMIKVNCAAIPENLIESELFGHEKGSFTGATERRVGKFELANNSTLFLDEIGEIPLELQTKLLRVLQESEFEPIGSKNTIKVNVRIIAATNRNLAQEVAKGNFRSDLFYRLNIFPIELPELRNRKEDIPVLANHFMEAFCHSSNKKIIPISPKVVQAMLIHSWPGNVRELKNSVERSILLSNGKLITEMDLSEPAFKEGSISEEHHIKSLQEVEKEHILKVIKLCNGRISGKNGAALKLGVPSTTLLSKMQKLGIQKGHSVKNTGNS